MRPAARWLPWVAVGSFILTGCSGTGDGGGGDPLSAPVANPYGGGSRIHELLGPATWENPNDEQSAQCQGIPPDRFVVVDGAAVTAVDRFDETSDGAVGNLYIQDSLLPAVPYSGVTVYDPSFSPPDLRVIPGDVVDLFGVLTEFPGPSVGHFNYCRTLPEIGGTMSFRFEEGQVDPVPVAPEDLASYAGMRQWLGVLVRMDNVQLTNDDPYESSSGRYSVRMFVGGGVQVQDIPTITNEMFDLKTMEAHLGAGSVLTSVTGVVTYFYGTHVAPRSADDIVP